MPNNPPAFPVPDRAVYNIDRYATGEPCLWVSYDIVAREDGAIDIEQYMDTLVRILPEQVDKLIVALKAAQSNVQAMLTERAHRGGDDDA